MTDASDFEDRSVYVPDADGQSSDEHEDGDRCEGGGGTVNVVMNIRTPDADGFRKSQSQIAAQLTRAIGRGQRNR